jgi:hypothetical protein
LNQFDNSALGSFVSTLYGFLDWIVVLITIGSVALGIYESRARVIGNGESILRYIDYTTDQLVVETEYRFKFGLLYAGKVSLPKVPREPRPRICYKPRIAHKQELPQDNYEDNAKGVHRYIKLTDKDFFEEAECKSVFVLTKVAEAASYKVKIEQSLNQDGITILNHNMEEIRNYSIELPPHVDLSVINEMFPHIDSFDPSKKEANTGGIVIVLKPIPPEEGTTPGRAFIPIRRVQASNPASAALAPSPPSPS